jgi:25/26-hydroxycholesterol 7alpha-hydroxylase
MALGDLVQTHPILSVAILLLLLAFSYHFLLIDASPSEPPFIKGYIPFLGTAPQVLPSPFKYLSACRAKYGDIFTLYAFGLRITFVADPIDGVPAIFRKTKQLSFKKGLDTFFTKVLGFTPERSAQEEMNKEHFAMIPPFLLATSAVDGLTGRFQRFYQQNIRKQVQKDESFIDGKVVDLFEWAGARLFYSSANSIHGVDTFDEDRGSTLEDYKAFDEQFPMRLILPLWMTKGFEKCRNGFRDALATKYSKGLVDPSDFVKRRIEVFSVGKYLTIDPRKIWIRDGNNWQ